MIYVRFDTMVKIKSSSLCAKFPVYKHLPIQ